MEGPTHLNIRKLRINREIFWQIVRIGLPAGIQSSVFSLSNVVIQSSINSFGSIVIAGNAAAMNVGSFIYQAMNTFHQAVTCFASQNLGARRPGRIRMTVNVCLFWALVFGLVMGVGSCLVGESLLAFYSTDPAVISAGMERMIWVCGPYFLCGIMDVMTGAMRGIGYSILPMTLSLIGACALRILWVATIFRAYPTIQCLMASYPVSWALTFLALIFFFRLVFREVCKKYTPEELAVR